MFLVLEIINPMYLLVACCCFMIVVGCACYGCYDIVSEKSLDAVAAGGVVACDRSDCEIPEIHEQHLEDKADGFWGKKAWGTDTDTCPGGIFDLPYDSTSMPDYSGGYGGSSGLGHNHLSIDMGYSSGGIDTGGGAIEGPLSGDIVAENDTSEIRIDMTEAASVDGKEATSLENIDNPATADATAEPEMIPDVNEDTSELQLTNKNSEKVGESTTEETPITTDDPPAVDIVNVYNASDNKETTSEGNGDVGEGTIITKEEVTTTPTTKQDTEKDGPVDCKD